MKGNHVLMSGGLAFFGGTGPLANVIGTATMFTVTVPSGKAGSDLTNVPLMVDLSDMPADFWLGADDGGGNIRVYQSDGSTLIPHDVTYCDVQHQAGRLYCRTNIASGTDTVVKVGVLAGGTSALASDDANGSEAVWQDYEAVVVFPDTVNRVDGTALTIVSGPKYGQYPFKEVSKITPSVGASQGMVFDGTNWWGTSNNALYKYNSSGTQVATNSDPLAAIKTATGVTALNHCGAPAVVEGELWVPIEEFTNSPYDTQFIGRYALNDLSYIGYYDISAEGREASAIFYDSVSGRVYVTDYTSSQSVPYYNTSGVYQATLTLTGFSLTNVQGMGRIGDKLYFNNSIDLTAREFDLDGAYSGLALLETYSSNESLSTYGSTIYTHGTNSAVRGYEVDARNVDWMRLHGAPMYVPITISNIFTAGIGWEFSPLQVQQTLVAVASVANNNNRAGILFDQGPDEMRVYDNLNSWIDPSPGYDPGTYTPFRAAMTYDGTTARKVFVNGAESGVDNTISEAPNGSVDFTIAGRGNASPERGYGIAQYAWIRDELMSDDWLAFDNLNNATPASTYSIT